VEYRLSDHARQEMERRRIPLSLLERVLRNPEQTMAESAGRTAYQSRQNIGGKMFLVRVIVDSAVDPAVVVTVYRTTKVQKYWRAP
jgi:hypothetical protein